MVFNESVKKILYGGDYNPEQWEESVWQEDMRLFKLAGIDIVTLNVFNWAGLQPDEETYHFEQLDEERTVFQGISLDYRRFNSDSLLNCYCQEADAVRAVTPNIPITTNLMGFYKTLDYQKWADSMDFISWDNYPSNEEHFAQIAMKHDLNRGLKEGSPFILMEQTPSVSNWLAYNALKRPGVMRLWSYQAVAHGADGVMFFQMRRSIGACEKFHGAVIDHAGHENTRVFREVAALGEELKILGDQTLGAVTKSEVAIVVDWDNWWALEYSAGPSRELNYLKEVEAYYRALHQEQISVDIIGSNDDFSKYKVLIAPLLYMVKAGVKEQLEAFTQSGGTFITSYFSGIVDENDLVETGGYPGRIREHNICSVMKNVPSEVEVTKRVNEKGTYLFVLNHSDILFVSCNTHQKNDS